MPKTKRRIFKLLAANLKTIRGYGVRRLGLFGSLARGKGRPASDIDLLVELEKKTFDAYLGLELFEVAYVPGL